MTEEPNNMTPDAVPDISGGQTPNELAQLSSNDLLIFEQWPLALRLAIVTVAGGTLAGVLFWLAPSDSWLFLASLPAISLVLFLAGVDRLSIDFSQRRYRACSGIWPFVVTTAGPLSDVSHVRLVSYMRKESRRNGFVLKRSVDVRIVWASHSPREFTLKTLSCDDTEVSIGSARKELRPYAGQLAARLDRILPKRDGRDAR